MTVAAILQGTVTGLEKAFDTAKAIGKLNTAVEVNNAAIELQTIILAAQRDINGALLEQRTLIDRIHELEKELTDTKAWESEKQKYDLIKLDSGVLVRSLKEDANTGEPPHHICPNCYEHAHKSILQKDVRAGGADYLLCHNCGADYLISGRRPSEHRPKAIMGYENRRRKNP